MPPRRYPHFHAVTLWTDGKAHISPATYGKMSRASRRSASSRASSPTPLYRHVLFSKCSGRIIKSRAKPNRPKSEMAWSKFTPGSMKPVHLYASDLFRGAAAGTAVAGEDLLGSGLHLICLLMRYRLMVNGCIVVNNGITCVSRFLVCPSVCIIRSDVAI